MTGVAIECVLKRDGGSRIELGNVEYHFKPNEVGAHVAQVTNRAHVNRFLSITEGYQLYIPSRPDFDVENEVKDSNWSNQPVPVSTNLDHEKMLIGSSSHPAIINLGGGKTITLGEAVEKAQLDSGLDFDGWNALADDDREARIDDVLDGLVVDESVDATTSTDTAVPEVKATEDAEKTDETTQQDADKSTAKAKK